MSNDTKTLQPVVDAIFSDARLERKSSYPSFARAKKQLSANLVYCIKYLNLTETLLANKINTFYNDPSLISSESMHQWVTSEKIPNLYILFKLSHYLKVSIDSLLKEDFSQTNRVIFGRSYAEQVDSPKVTTEEVTRPFSVTVSKSINTNSTITTLSNNSTKDTTKMKTSNNNRVMKISRTRKTEMESLVREHTDSREANLLLANTIYSSDMALKTIADKVGVSTRSLRDYAFYNTTVPGITGDKLAKLFKTSVRSLGLYLNNETGRYEHMTVSVQ